MKIKIGFKLHQIGKEFVVVAQGLENVDFTKMITLNGSAAFLWQQLENGVEFNKETIVDLLTSRYEINKETALADGEKFIESLLSSQLIED